MPLLKVNQIASYSGNTLTLGTTGDTINVASGVTFNTASATVNYPAGSITNAAIASAAAIATTKLGVGAVLQVVQTTSVSSLTTTAASFVTLNLAATITPSSASNKILMLFSTNAQNTTGSNGCVITIFRGSIASGTNLGDSNWGFGNYGQVGGATDSLFALFPIMYLDSPSTTSAITYTPAGKANAGANLVTSFGASRGSLILMEIAG